MDQSRGATPVLELKEDGGVDVADDLASFEPTVGGGALEWVKGLGVVVEEEHGKDVSEHVVLAAEAFSSTCVGSDMMVQLFGGGTGTSQNEQGIHEDIDLELASIINKSQNRKRSGMFLMSDLKNRERNIHESNKVLMQTYSPLATPNNSRPSSPHSVSPVSAFAAAAVARSSVSSPSVTMSPPPSPFSKQLIGSDHEDKRRSARIASQTVPNAREENHHQHVKVHVGFASFMEN